MSLQNAIDTVKKQNPLWKNNSRIIGRASEIYCCIHMKCTECNSSDWLECITNEKSKDQICNTCKKQYQIKCKKTTPKQCNTIKTSQIFKTIGAEYNTTLKSIGEGIDYIIILYDKNNDILDILHIKSEDITRDNIIPRNKLSETARRAGWQGCNLSFTNVRFINSVF